MSLKINVIQSSSSGNAVEVSDDKSRILLDAGLTYSKLSGAINVSGLEVVLITHEHMDHWECVPELVRRGVRVGMSRGTALEKNFTNRYDELKHLSQVEYENWWILLILAHIPNDPYAHE